MESRGHAARYGAGGEQGKKTGARGLAPRADPLHDWVPVITIDEAKRPVFASAWRGR